MKKEWYYRISREDLLEFIEAVYRLVALEQGGVDDWEYYGDSINDFLKNYIKQENIVFNEENDEYEKDFTFSEIALKEIKNYDTIEE